MGVPYAEVIGDPIAHSKSPAIHEFWLEKLSVRGEYRKTKVESQHLPSFLDARRRDPDWRGCNLTMPHKQSALPLIDERHDYGAGAVNCIVPKGRRLIGYNTDGAGLESAMTAVEWDLPICLIGAGGAASAVPAVVDWCCVFHFNVIARDPGRGRAFLDRLNMHGDVFSFDRAADAMRECQGVVNASPLGMAGFPAMPDSVLDALSELPRDGWVVDMVYEPVDTVLLQRARALSLATGDGLTVLTGQAAAAFHLFFGQRVPDDYRKAAREVLDA